MTKDEYIEKTEKIHHILGQSDYANELMQWLVDYCNAKPLDEEFSKDLGELLFNLNNKLLIDLNDLKMQIKQIREGVK
ncbi:MULTISPECIES: hypothetical protein [Staphylococcus]|uniref:hypothetical protein n=1 Tax=Staphylococcus TaxID=1279 RepID=UPI0008FAF112|nr:MULTISPECIES: hypothetical protein [Staphylococcus]MDV3052474.1 hypothetical protein [Staphylococcus ureilyticus]OIS31395.1 hypothetical protein RES9_01880 [Staphylococcus cohnii]OIS32323.1 hypothetical protein RES10_04630 [Staphylococcus cohnii]OIS33068.1 hypothetical protein RES8_05300 [Staphylococcus cohnii]